MESTTTQKASTCDQAQPGIIDNNMETNKPKSTSEIDDRLDLPLRLPKEEIPRSPDVAESVHEFQRSPTSTLNITEQSTSISHEKRSRMLQSCGTTSLPYVNSSKSESPCTYLSLRNKYSDSYEDELESSEEPYDFSRRYSETRRPDNLSKDKCSNNTKYKYRKPKNDNENFSIYAETDLDQPTDYSLRYAEDDSDSEVCDDIEKTATEYIRDTVKTYCTEGTPYETPINFSTSTSMSDLRLNEKGTMSNEKIPEKENKPEEVKINDDKAGPSQASENTEPQSQQPQMSKSKSEFSSGLASPEKPMNYCEEGTPGYFSRVSSFASLNSTQVLDEEKGLMDKAECNSEGVSPKIDDKTQQKIAPGDVKVVKFESSVNYCEETPLMFSRSSSLASLDSMEQHSIHDDRSSIISDFSRLTSGIISPSELPDSPTQTVPPSPNPQKTPEFPIIHRRTSGDGRSYSSTRRSLPKTSVFEDGVTKFKEENTPTQFSVATSLSSLTIDDQDEHQGQEIIEGNALNKSDTSNDGSWKHSNRSNEGAAFRSGEASGVMQDRRQPQFFRSAVQSTSSFEDPSSFKLYKNAKFRAQTPPLPMDNLVHTYCTEDTPAVLSHNGSISGLSTLSMLDEEPVHNRVYLSENSSESSGRNNNVVDDEAPSQLPQTRNQTENSWEQRDSTRLLNRHFDEENIRIPVYFNDRDEVSRFAVEDSPAQFSLRSSLSNLTFESGLASAVKDNSLKESASPKSDASESHSGENVESVEGLIEDIEPVRREQTQNVDVGPHSVRLSVENIDTLADSAGQSLAAAHEFSIASERNQTEEHETAFGTTDCENASEASGSMKCEGSFSYGSFKRRKWRWRWLLGSEQNESRATASSTGSTTPNSEMVDNLPDESLTGIKVDAAYTRSLDSSFKKKKWWKWKFGSKETKDNTNGIQIPRKSDLGPTGSENTPKFNIVDCNEENKSRKEEEGPTDSRSKSKRWKWRWKFASKDDDYSRPDKLSMSFAKFKQSVSPTATRETYIIDGSAQADARQSRLSTFGVPRVLSRSHSEPRGSKKMWDDTGCKLNAIQCSAISTRSNSVLDETDTAEREPEELKTKESVLLSNEVKGLEVLQSEAVNTVRCFSNPQSLAVKTGLDQRRSEENVVLNPDYATSRGECVNHSMPIEKTDQAEPQLMNVGTSSVVRSSEIDSISTITALTDSVNHMSLFEECIQMGMPKKKQVSQEAIYANLPPACPRSNSLPRRRETTPKTIPEKHNEITPPRIGETESINGNSFLDECIRMGMPNKKADMLKKQLVDSQPTETKPCSSTVKSLKPDYAALLEECIQMGMPKKKEPSEEAIYANLSPTPGYSMSNSMPRSREPSCKPIGRSKEPAPSKIGILENSHQLVEDRAQQNDHLEGSRPSVIAEHRSNSIPRSKGASEHYKNMMPKNMVVDNSRLSETKSLLEECILLGMPAKKENMSKNQQAKTPTSENIEISSNSMKVVEKPDYAALFQECIQMGMPKKKEVPDEVIYANLSLNTGSSRSNSMPRQRQLTSKVFSEKDEAAATSATVMDIRKSGSSQQLLDECIQLGMPKKSNSSEGEIFTNNPVVSEFSRSNSIPRSRQVPDKCKNGMNSVNKGSNYSKNLMNDCIMMGLSTKREEITEKQQIRAQFSENIEPRNSSSQCKEKPDYAALLEECIQMGMPRRIEKTEETHEHRANSLQRNSSTPTSRTPIVNTNSIEQKDNNQQNYMNAVGGNNIGGLSNYRGEPEEPIYANTAESYMMPKSHLKPDIAFERSLPKKIPTLDSELGLSRTQLEGFGNSRTESSFLMASTSASQTLEECIQAGWPRKRQTITISRTIKSDIISESSRVISVENNEETNSKNVNVASVARSTPEYWVESPNVQAMAIDAEDVSEQRSLVNPAGTLGTVDQTRNGFNGAETMFHDEEKSEISFASLGEVDTSLLDPEIVLRSLDRYTAELISQSEFILQNRNKTCSNAPTTSEPKNDENSTRRSRKRKSKTKTVNFKDQS